MEDFIGNFEIDEQKIKNEVGQWKDNLKAKIEKNKVPKKFLKLKRALGVTSFALILIFITLVMTITFNQEYIVHPETGITAIGIIFIMAIIFTSLAIVGFIAIFIKVKTYKKINVSDEVEDQGEDQCMHWFMNAFNHEIVPNENKELFAFEENDIERLIKKYRYRTLGTPIGMSYHYDIMGGKIFNNPFSLTCGVYQSTSYNRDNHDVVFEYMPLLQVKTKHFSNVDILICNSKRFRGHKKNTTQFENKKFQAKFSIDTKNTIETLIMFTKIVQDKWVELAEDIPRFQMHIKNGMIYVLFEGFSNDELWQDYPTTIPFMNIPELFEKVDSTSRFFRKVEANVFKDLNSFISIINLIFSLSHFQWENLANENEKND